MSQRLVLVALLLGGSAALGTFLGQSLRPVPPPVEPPPAVVPKPEEPSRRQYLDWDVGTTPPGKELTKKFEVPNKTPVMWTLKDSTASCTCARAQLSARAVKPGVVLVVEVQYKAPRKEGKASGVMVVEFEQPTSPVLHITVAGVVARETGLGK